MNEELKVRNAGGTDVVRLVLAILAVIAGITAFYVQDSAPSWERWAAVVAGIAVGFGIIATSAYGRAVFQFMLDSRVELRKIVWPERRETGMTTLIVFGFVAFGGIFFWLVDLLLALAIRHLTGQGG